VSFGLPNLLSMLRMAIIPFFAIAIFNGHPGQALILFLIAGITDGLDGFLARVMHQTSVLGTYLDPIADKLLLITAYVLLAIPRLSVGAAIPTWVSALVIARDVLIMLLALLFFLAMGISRFLPTVLSKINTTIQITGIIAVLTAELVPAFVSTARVLIYLVATFTILSGLDYIYRANKMVGSKGDEET